MDEELIQLEQKINQLIELVQTLAQDNQSLRISIEKINKENEALRNSMQQASDRVEKLLADLPENLS